MTISELKAIIDATITDDCKGWGYSSSLWRDRRVYVNDKKRKAAGYGEILNGEPVWTTSAGHSLFGKHLSARLESTTKTNTDAPLAPLAGDRIDILRRDNPLMQESEVETDLIEELTADALY